MLDVNSNIFQGIVGYPMVFLVFYFVHCINIEGGYKVCDYQSIGQPCKWVFLASDHVIEYTFYPIGQYFLAQEPQGYHIFPNYIFMVYDPWKEDSSEKVMEDSNLRFQVSQFEMDFLLFHGVYYKVDDNNGMLKVIEAYWSIKSVGHPFRGKFKGFSQSGPCE